MLAKQAVSNVNHKGIAEAHVYVKKVADFYQTQFFFYNPFGQRIYADIASIGTDEASEIKFATKFIAELENIVPGVEITKGGF